MQQHFGNVFFDMKNGWKLCVTYCYKYTERSVTIMDQTDLNNGYEDCLKTLNDLMNTWNLSYNGKVARAARTALREYFAPERHF